MTSKEIRQSFFDFFENKLHKIVPSAPVIPHGDPTLLFTNAGMNQFKDVFLGSGNREYKRAADTQKCIRVSGKHNDLEEVGRDTYHHTFFEMLGNWSFGDYYKNEAIEWAWELLTDLWKLPKERLHATVYRTDDEAYEIWKKYLPADRIHRFDEKDNFWEMGETGPCGPCSEIHYDRTPDLSGGKYVNAGVPEVIEIWNLVFIQFNRKVDGTLENLTSKHVDTGMGFERICAVIQGKNSNYDTDVFMPIIREIERLSGIGYNGELIDNNGIAMRVIADHVRTLSFAIADGAMPGNEGRGYVLRRLLRRASRYARNLNFSEPVLYKLVGILVENMGEIFPEIIQQRQFIERIIKAEEENFLQTLDRGLDRFDEIITRIKTSGETIIPGSDAFLLFDSFGFPLDLTEVIARENNFSVDSNGFNSCMDEQRRRSRDARKVKFQQVDSVLHKEESEFIGYSESVSEGKVLSASENRLILDRTPFYTESGGQVSDTGEIILAGEKYFVSDMQKSGNAIIHILDREVEPLIGEIALAKVDLQKRKHIMRNHSVTHLLHEALRTILGSHVQQAGSLVSPDYLRFDFNHFEKVPKEAITEIEVLVNSKILDAIPVETMVLKLEEARKNPKIKMFFGDKYGDTVRLVVMDNKYSMELCGGTHVKNTSEIGAFKITAESSIAAGVRRIEAVSGAGVQKYLNELIAKVDEKQQNNVELSEKIKSLEKKLEQFKIEEFKQAANVWIDTAYKIDSIRIITRQIEVNDLDVLRSIAENLRNSLGKQGVALLTAVMNDKIQLVCTVTDDLMKTIPAGQLASAAAAAIGGSGGGRPHLATAGGKDLSLLPELLKNFPDIVKEKLGK
ncbi:MAG: alaS [Ignavibacteria bacterium]|nr:alaS [Ignavibacteria bacterium]